MRRLIRRGVTVTAVMAVAVLLSACSGGVGPTAPQSTEQTQQSGETSAEQPTEDAAAGGDDLPTLSGACQEISQAMTNANDEMGTALQNGLTDPEGVKEALLLQAEALQNAVTITKNPEVKTALQAVADDMGAFADVFQGLPDLTNPGSWAGDPVAVEAVTSLGAKLQAAGAELNASLGELLTLCDYTP